jgi:serine/threonine protein kinase
MCCRWWWPCQNKNYGEVTWTLLQQAELFEGDGGMTPFRSAQGFRYGAPQLLAEGGFAKVTFTCTQELLAWSSCSCATGSTCSKLATHSNVLPASATIPATAWEVSKLMLRSSCCGATLRVELARGLTMGTLQVYKTILRLNPGEIMDVAVKEAAPTFAATQALRQEVDVLCVLGGHPHICPLLDVVVDSTRPDAPYVAVVLPLYRDGSLFDFTENWRRARPGLPPLEHLLWTLNLLRDTVSGLSHVHGLGIVHNDVKEDNVLLDGQLRCSISDFGLSRRLCTQQGALGTWDYMAPEVRLVPCSSMILRHRVMHAHVNHATMCCFTA